MELRRNARPSVEFRREDRLTVSEIAAKMRRDAFRIPKNPDEFAAEVKKDQMLAHADVVEVLVNEACRVLAETREVLGTDWKPDIDDPGTSHEVWTGKWGRTIGGETNVVPADIAIESADFARRVAVLVNSAPLILAELDARNDRIAQLEARLLEAGRNVHS